MNTNAIKPRKILRCLEKYRNSKAAIIITGFRRVGKTTVLKAVYDSTESSNKLFLDLETPVNQRLFANENYESIILSLQGLGIDFSRQSFIFLDEIQFVKNIPSVVKYLFDHYSVKFYLTGSSSFYLKNHFTESLAGRKYVFNLYPLDFEEFLWFKDIQYDLQAFAAVSPDVFYDRFFGLYNEYMEFGGFPQVALEKSSAEKRLKLNDIIGAYFQLDVQSLAHFKDNDNLKKLLFLLPRRIGSKLDTGKLAQALGVTRSTVQSYIGFFEQTFLVNLLKPFSRSRDVEIKKKPKIYLLDTGIIGSLEKMSTAQILENKVFNQLFARSAYDEQNNLADPLQYYATKQGQEIDFIYKQEIAYEVKQRASLHDVHNLKKRAQSLGIPHYYVITLEQCPNHPRIIYPFFLHAENSPNR